MLPADMQTRREAFDLIEQVLGACGAFSAEDNKRLEMVARLFGVDAAFAAAANPRVVPMPAPAKAS